MTGRLKWGMMMYMRWSGDGGLLRGLGLLNTTGLAWPSLEVSRKAKCYSTFDKGVLNFPMCELIVLPLSCANCLAAQIYKGNIQWPFNWSQVFP